MIPVLDISDANAPYDKGIFDWDQIARPSPNPGTAGLGAMDAASNDTALIQQKLSVPQTGVWDQATAAALSRFQGMVGRTPNGIPDPLTLAALGIYDPLAGAPGSYRQWIAGGSRPGSIGRDLATVTNQVPQWAWLTLSVLFGGLAYFSWRRRGRS